VPRPAAAPRGGGFTRRRSISAAVLGSVAGCEAAVTAAVHCWPVICDISPNTSPGAIDHESDYRDDGAANDDGLIEHHQQDHRRRGGERCHREDLDPILHRRPEIAEGLATVMAEHEARNETRDRKPEQAVVKTWDDLLARLRQLFRL
jgi:hypothetical protein